MNYILSAIRGQWSRNQPTPIYKRLFYRLKAVVCLTLNHEPSELTMDDSYFYESFFSIWTGYGGVSPGNDHHPMIYWGEYIGVGPGILSNWWAFVGTASSD